MSRRQTKVQDEASTVPTLTLAASQRLEARMLRYIEHVEQARSAEDLEDATAMARIFLEVMTDNGYHPVAAEGFQARARKAAAQSRFAQASAEAAEKSPAGINAAGLDVPYFCKRLKGVLSILSNYSPAELARECARMARQADPRVLTEDEFQ